MYLLKYDMWTGRNFEMSSSDKIIVVIYLELHRCDNGILNKESSFFKISSYRNDTLKVVFLSY